MVTLCSRLGVGDSSIRYFPQHDSATPCLIFILYDMHFLSLPLSLFLSLLPSTHARTHTKGTLRDWTPFTEQAHQHDTLVVGCTDLMASVVLKPVGEMGFDIAVGSAQRFGVPMGFGGPHAGFIATTNT